MKVLSPLKIQSTPRKHFVKPEVPLNLTVPNLVEHQKKSFDFFVTTRLRRLFDSINPIEDQNQEKYVLRFKDYYFDKPKLTVEQARHNNKTYEASLRVNVELENKITKTKKTHLVYLGDYPWMTDNGTFIINNSEKVIVSQISSSSGVYFSAKERDGQNYYSALISPARGIWLTIETNFNNTLSIRINRRRGLPITTFLNALGMTGQAIRDAFAKVDSGEVRYIDETFNKTDNISYEDAIIEVYRRIRPGDLTTYKNAKQTIEDRFFNPSYYDLSITGRHKFNERLKLPKVEDEEDIKNKVLSLEDLVVVISEVIRLNNSQEAPDDRDSLSIRRIRTSGELIATQFRIGLIRMERNIKERMLRADLNTDNPNQLINPRPLIMSVLSFFKSSQLSQFMDQENPVSEISHKRKLSSMGQGGLNRERASFEVRDAHITHYGRICPVETPEGTSVGLVLNLALYARINDYGFIETPYRKIINEVSAKQAAGHVARGNLKAKDGKIIVKAGQTISPALAKRLATEKETKFWLVKPKVTDEIVYLTAQDEKEACIASMNNPVNEQGYFSNDYVEARDSWVASYYQVGQATHMDICANQILGAPAGLIPFIEKDSVDRSLTGSNQTRQALPLIKPEAPIVATGLESVIARDSGQVQYAQAVGEVLEATAEKVVVSYGKTKETYYPTNFVRSNNDTIINQRVVVSKGQKVKQGDILFEGSPIDNGEIALGKDVLVALMFWDGDNFEDAVVISDRLSKEDVFTSINITKYSMEVRETKLGPEVITRDIPNVSEDSLRYLDEDGLIQIGSKVTSGDILVGKITPKGEQELNNEDRLLRVIFGEKAKDVRDTSLRLPNGKEEGKVIDVRIFSKERGDSLAAGVLQKLEVVVAESRKIQIGDKIAGRHGNKGVIAKIVRQEDMPFTAEGQPIDLIFNPLSVPARMNLGQIFEANLGMAAKLHDFKVVSPSLNGVKQETITELFRKAGLAEDGKQQLFDGRSGRPFSERTTVGYMYISKLKHMVDDKIHVRSTGPYTMVTQQPLRGKKQGGGQRVGEMEVWALMAHKAVHNLQEILTIKSDDIQGRKKAYEAIIKQIDIPEPRVPESFNVLIRELQGIGLKVELVDSEPAGTDHRNFPINLDYKALEKLSTKPKGVKKK